MNIVELCGNNFGFYKANVLQSEPLLLIKQACKEESLVNLLTLKVWSDFKWKFNVFDREVTENNGLISTLPKFLSDVNINTAFSKNSQQAEFVPW